MGRDAFIFKVLAENGGRAPLAGAKNLLTGVFE
jgi:hypothetical protein